MVCVEPEIPGPEVPGQNKTDKVVFREAATGRELALSSQVPAMTQGSAIQPGYGGSVFFPVGTGMLIKVTPTPSWAKTMVDSVGPHGAATLRH